MGRIKSECFDITREEAIALCKELDKVYITDEVVKELLRELELFIKDTQDEDKSNKGTNSK